MAKKMKAKDLVDYCLSKVGTPYVYGGKMEILTKEKYDYLKKTYGDLVWDSDVQHVGKCVVDCSGLISAACGVQRGSSQWKSKATKIFPIKEYKKVPVGAMCWMQGHIGVYLGVVNGVPKYVAADGSKYGVRVAPLKENKFTHFLLDENIFDYEKEDDEVVTKGLIEVNGKEYTVEMINKDGYTYVKTRDIANACGFDVSNKGKIPVLTEKK